jgi:cardiolipin synthase
VVWYQPFRWYTLKRWNNRTHRELLIVDDTTAFIGGAGIGDGWDTGTGKLPPWRDLMVRVSGAPARGLQSVFVQSWLESSGEILLNYAMARSTSIPAQTELFTEERAVAFVLGSTPTGGRATRARVMYQLLVGASRDSLLIDSPYFVPDKAMRQALLQAVARGVRVTILTPGEHNNHPIARLASRRHYGELIAGGIDIFEYQPGMLHSKILLVDGLWSVVGSTNFDNRSFGLNNEVNLIQRDPEFAAQLNRTIIGYLGQSRKISLAEWSHRSLLERGLAGLGSVLERQE